MSAPPHIYSPVVPQMDASLHLAQHILHTLGMNYQEGGPDYMDRSSPYNNFQSQDLQYAIQNMLLN